MQHLRSSVLGHLRLSAQPFVSAECRRPLYGLMARYIYSSSNNTSSEHLTARVIELVKKFDKIDASKDPFSCIYGQVTETADFQKDLSLDSLDRVELVMAFEQEFSIEIPDDEANKLTCCVDVVKYIEYEAQSVGAKNS